MGFAEFRKQQMQKKKAAGTTSGKVIVVLPDGSEITGIRIKGGSVDPKDVETVERESGMVDIFFEEDGVLINDLQPDKRYHVRGKQTIVSRTPNVKIGFGCPKEVLLHEPPNSRVKSHPELPSRVLNTLRLLESVGIVSQMTSIEPELVTLSQLSLTHSVDLLASVFPLSVRSSCLPSYPNRLYPTDNSYITTSVIKPKLIYPHSLYAAPSRELIVTTAASTDEAALVTETVKKVPLPSDTYTNSYSSDAVLKSVGTLLRGCKLLLNESVKAALCLIRPPGHHCSSSSPSGFCLVNNVAVVANIIKQDALKNQKPVPRVAILDWDVHHGDGTQQIFESDPNILFISIHRYDKGAFYPHTGSPEGVGDFGNMFNVGFNTSKASNLISDTAFDICQRYLVTPLIKNWCPDVIIVSAGFDAAKGDPLGQQSVVHGFANMTSALMELPSGVAFALEGGYNSDAVSQSVLSCVKVLHGYPPPKLSPSPPEHQQWALQTILTTLSVDRPVSSLTPTIQQLTSKVTAAINSLQPSV